MHAKHKQKLGDTRGVSSWSELSSIGDVKRMLRWAVLSFRNQTLTCQQCNTFIVAANTLAHVIKTSDFEERLDSVEKLLKGGSA